MDNDIKTNIKYYRKKRQLTQKQLAALIDKTESSVKKYESGATQVPFDVLTKIAEVLNITINELIQGEIESNKRYWEAIKCFSVNDIEELIKDLKQITINKRDKKELYRLEKSLNRAIYRYENLILPLSKELKIGGIDIIYGDKLKAATEMTRDELIDIEEALKDIKDDYI